ncbi:Aim21p NDAI_0B01010 [Naumovozyma dairenensis CBS 421]|uniref:Altered inheritance of mitochondria protein 21 n=1 Tax=Naumovozyma dairenensis (strain ATCC 10597 / BCRC 20456 / CBS 421 / NBRC 0211 / NRRL Y-12639) TaxID=1071378 RepID=G0W5S4_NAUDC|nr:hypothetical protein NDAI_0B01010 [Naumovozyma dairenensis CBS 421]CCD23135.1 hypothetical protein NDAI_0B01010 [Naumovozyma dairenensis CBS 421]
MSQSDLPHIPERPRRRKTSPMQSSLSQEELNEVEPSLPATGQASVKETTPSIPSRRPIRKAQTIQTIGNNDINTTDVETQIPLLPERRPMKHSVTEEIDNLIQNTDSELKEMENMLSSVHAQIPHPPRRPNKNHGTATSNHGHEENINSQGDENDTKQQNLVHEMGEDGLQGKKSSNKSFSSIKEPVPDGSSEGNVVESIGNIFSEPMLQTSQPKIAEEGQVDNSIEVTEGTKEETKDQSVDTTDSVAMPSPESEVVTTDPASKVKEVVEEHENENKNEEQLQEKVYKDEDDITVKNDIATSGISSKAEPAITPKIPERRPTIGRVDTPKMESISHDNIVEVIHADVKEEGLQGKAETETIEAVPSDDATPTILPKMPERRPAISSTNSSAKEESIFEKKNEGHDIVPHKEEKENKSEMEPKVDILSNVPESTPVHKVDNEGEAVSEDIDTDLRTGQEPSVEEPAVSPSKGNDELLSEGKEEEAPEEEAHTEEAHKQEAPEEEAHNEEKVEPKIPERPKKRAPPPVPKKPSSRIAALHEMLKKQQEENMAKVNEPFSKGSEKENDSKDTDNEGKAEFVKNLNGLFALPGMAPGGPILNKKLSPDAASNAVEEQLNLKQAEEAMGDESTGMGTRRRARGPRGRKLPSKIAKTEKIVDIKEDENVIQIFNTWKIVCRSEGAVVKSDGLGSLDKEGKEGQEEHEEEVENDDDEFIDALEIKEIESHHGKRHVSESVAIKKNHTGLELEEAVADAIDSRDQDDSIEILEQGLEDEAQSAMERQMMEEDKPIDELLKDQSGLN